MTDDWKPQILSAVHIEDVDGSASVGRAAKRFDQLAEEHSEILVRVVNPSGREFRVSVKAECLNQPGHVSERRAKAHDGFVQADGHFFPLDGFAF